MTCQTCGEHTSNRPALCDDCRAERDAHRRAKAGHRAAVLSLRKPKPRHSPGVSQ